MWKNISHKLRTNEILKYGEAVTDWLRTLCNLVAWKGKCLDTLLRQLFSQFVKEKHTSLYSLYRGLLSLFGKMFSKILIKIVQKFTRDKISEEQSGFRTKRGCIDQVYNMRKILKMLA